MLSPVDFGFPNTRTRFYVIAVVAQFAPDAFLSTSCEHVDLSASGCSLLDSVVLMLPVFKVQLSKGFPMLVRFQPRPQKVVQ